jgi:hypothetical protein
MRLLELKEADLLHLSSPATVFYNVTNTTRYVLEISTSKGNGIKYQTSTQENMSK